MDRLTYWCDDGQGGGEWSVNVNCREESGPHIDRLAAYEDTGLEPEEIKSLQAEWGVNLKALESYRRLGSFDRLSKLSEADKEGRIVVLPKIPNCDTCPLCGEYGECKITGYPPNPEKCREVIRKEAALKEATL